MSQELAGVVAVGIVTAAIFWTSFRFGDSEDLFISTLGQVFHGLGMASLLVLLGVAIDAASPGVAAILTPYLVVLTVVVVLYVLLMTSRAIISLVVDGYEWFTKKIRGREF